MTNIVEDGSEGRDPADHDEARDRPAVGQPRDLPGGENLGYPPVSPLENPGTNWRFIAENVFWLVVDLPL